MKRLCWWESARKDQGDRRVLRRASSGEGRVPPRVSVGRGWWGQAQALGRLLLACGVSLWLALPWACAPARSFTPTPVPGWEEVANEFPQPPADLPPKDQKRFEEGWRALVSGDLAAAAERLERLGKRQKDNPSVSSALGFLELRLGNRRLAEDRFQQALRMAPGFAAAQAGTVLAALAEGREEVAFERLRLLEKEHPEHTLVRRYLHALQLKLAESRLQSARSLRRQQRYREAVEAYRQALKIVPEASGLYAEAAQVELLGQQPEQAAAHAAKAVELEPENADLHRLRGDALAQLGELERAVDAYEKALSLRPQDSSLSALLEQTRRKLRRESLPPQVLEITQVDRITREQLAALLYVKLRPLLDGHQEANVIATDIAGSWAGEFIRQIVGVGIMDIFPNHTFQPKSFVRKSELAAALMAAVETLSRTEDLPSSTHVTLADVSPESLDYRSAAQAVELGLLTTDSQGRFEPRRLVTGQEAADAVEALAKRLTRS